MTIEERTEEEKQRLTALLNEGPEMVHRSTHNHPKGSENEYTFSGDDLRLFGKYQLNLLRGIDELFQYELNRHLGDVDKLISVFDMDEHAAQHSSVIDYALKHGYGYRRKQRAKR